MGAFFNGEFKKSFEKILGRSVDETIARRIIKDVQKWLNEEVLPYLPFDIVKYKRDEHLTVNTSLTAKVEENAKEVILPLIPRWMGPDVLTFIGMVGSVMIGYGFYHGYSNKDYLSLVIVGLIVNWFGDSFDGSVARYWKRTRPNYGYYIDHIIDGIAVFVGGMGLAYSGYVKPDNIYIIVILYLLMEIHVLLRKTVENTFNYTFGLLGPTEGRIIIGFFTIYMYFSDTIYFNFLATQFSQYDVAIFSLSSLMAAILLVSIVKEGSKLHKQDIKLWRS